MRVKVLRFNDGELISPFNDYNYGRCLGQKNDLRGL